MAETKTHWKKLTNPNYIGSYDFEEKEVRTLTITNVKLDTVIGPEGKKEECTVAYFTTGKPMIINATNAKTITKISGSPYIEDWAGVSIMVHVVQVKAFGDLVDALRVKPEKVKEQDVSKEIKMLEACKSLKELADIYLSFPPPVQKLVTKRKDELKAALA